MLEQNAIGRWITGHNRFTAKQLIALTTPPVLVLTMTAGFQGLISWLGWLGGYLAGFVIYWLGWCIILPVYLLGGVRPLLDLFREGRPDIRKLSWKMQLALWWPMLFPLVFIFIPGVQGTNLPVLLISGLLGITTAVTEEILWRGVYVRLFPGQFMLNSVYPSVGFALWHIAPQLARPNSLPGGAASFLTYALALGLSYAYYARKTGSIRWCTISHTIHDTLGLGGRVYVPWLG